MSNILNWFQSIWPFVAHAGTGVTVMAGLLAAAYFSPFAKKEFVYAAVAVGIGLFVYGVGVHDESHRRDLREQQLVKSVHDAVRRAIESGEPDPYDDPNI